VGVHVNDERPKSNARSQPDNLSFCVPHNDLSFVFDLVSSTAFRRRYLPKTKARLKAVLQTITSPAVPSCALNPG
jgi:hypothetical protein